MSKVVLTYGTFDLFHIGHLRLLERARALGDSLIVGVSTDEFNAVKGKKTVIDFGHRVEIIRSLRCVDTAFPETCWEQKRTDVAKYKVSTLVMGDDWVGKFDFLKEQCEVIYLPRTEGISTTELKTGIASQASAGAHNVRKVRDGLAAADLQLASANGDHEKTRTMCVCEECRRRGLLLLNVAEHRAV